MSASIARTSSWRPSVTPLTLADGERRPGVSIVSIEPAPIRTFHGSRARGHTTVDHHCLPGNKLGFVAGEEERHVGDIFGMAGSLQRTKCRQQLLHLIRVAGQEVEDRRVDTARADAIHAESCVSPLPTPRNELD